MKTIEQKARAYDEAIERARVYWKTDNDNTLDIKARGTMEHLFPELKESENEKIRKEIMSYIKSSGAITNKQWIAWLEKQGTSYTKRDVDDAYVEGMTFAKNELEKQKPTWSEEDEERFQSCLNILQVQAKGFMGITETINTKWLKSLKQRIGWKPSDEQLLELRCVISGCSYETPILIQLEQDLKKLL